MEVILVSDLKLIQVFHKIPETIYKNDKNWAPQLQIMVEDIFDPKKNTGFVNGDAKRWVVKQNDVFIGRIAAFFDKSKLEEGEENAGGIGFFDCVNDVEASNLLFDTACNWLKKEGLTAMDGPINFGENFFNWGLLVDGFQEQGFGMQYNKPYYKDLFEKYGFFTYYQQFSYHIDISSPDLPERFWKIAEWVIKKKDFHYKKFSFKEEDKCIADFIKIHQQAWDKHTNFKPIVHNDLKALIRDAKMLLEEDFIWYVYYKDEPIAFFMMVPDLNQILRKLSNGKLNIINILKILWYKKTKSITRCRSIVMGVIPRFQNSGIESGLFWHLRQVMLKKNWYKEMELSWVGDFNPKMISLFNSVGSKYAKTHETMRYLFDRSKPSVRLPIIKS